MDIKELKSKAYDTLAEIQFLQGKLQQLNQVIAEESKKQKETQEEIKAE